jgi:hypothetical protein
MCGEETGDLDEYCTYWIEVQGQIDDHDLITMSPLEVTATQVNAATTYFSVHTDQSGLIGLLRHLHARGLMLLSVICKTKPIPPGGKNAS